MGVQLGCRRTREVQEGGHGHSDGEASQGCSSGHVQVRRRSAHGEGSPSLLLSLLSAWNPHPRAQLLSNNFPLHTRVARSISPSETTVRPSEILFHMACQHLLHTHHARLQKRGSPLGVALGPTGRRKRRFGAGQSLFAAPLQTAPAVLIPHFHSSHLPAYLALFLHGFPPVSLLPPPPTLRVRFYESRLGWPRGVRERACLERKFPYLFSRCHTLSLLLLTGGLYSIAPPHRPKPQGAKRWRTRSQYASVCFVASECLSHGGDLMACYKSLEPLG